MSQTISNQNKNYSLKSNFLVFVLFKHTQQIKSRFFNLQNIKILKIIDGFIFVDNITTLVY